MLAGEGLKMMLQLVEKRDDRFEAEGAPSEGMRHAIERDEAWHFVVLGSYNIIEPDLKIDEMLDVRSQGAFCFLGFLCSLNISNSDTRTADRTNQTRLVREPHRRWSHDSCRISSNLAICGPRMRRPMTTMMMMMMWYGLDVIWHGPLGKFR